MRYLKLVNNLETQQVFKKEIVSKWKCRQCGHIHEGNTAPVKCLTCDHLQGYFQIKASNY